jgi:hypothetical protein
MKKYDIKIKIIVEPSYIDIAPYIVCGIGTTIFLQQSINSSQEIIIEDKLSEGNHRFFLKLTNKNYNISKKEKDMHIKIKHIGFQDIEDNFHYFSKYKPEYPTEWLQKQNEIGKEWTETILSDHMGWNGIYYIDFETPIYKWIHKKLNLGWLI